MTDDPSFFNEHYGNVNVALTKKKTARYVSLDKRPASEKKMYVNVIDTRSHLLKKGLIWFTTTY